jgi:PPOX class probable F420-dependent enzyme
VDHQVTLPDKQAPTPKLGMATHIARRGAPSGMNVVPDELRDLMTSGPMAHLTTINADGSPQVSVIWIGLDGDQPVSGHMTRGLKLRNIEHDPRVVLSFDAPREPGVFLNPYAVLHARATVEPSDRAWDLLNRLTKIYLSPGTEFPAPRGPGYIVRYSIERIAGVGPWGAD